MYILCMGMKRFNFWIDDLDLKKIKEEAKKERLSISKFIQKKTLSEIDKSPNITTGNWWDNPNKIKEVAKKSPLIKEVAKQLAKELK